MHGSVLTDRRVVHGSVLTDRRVVHGRLIVYLQTGG